MSKRYTVSDGKLVLTLEEAEEGGFVVSSPLYPGLWTQAESVSEAFDNARDALKALIAARRKPLPSIPARKKGKVAAA
jgi:predicted RNase H-like HicB family nuclease